MVAISSSTNDTNIHDNHASHGSFLLCTHLRSRVYMPKSREVACANCVVVARERERNSMTSIAQTE